MEYKNTIKDLIQYAKNLSVSNSIITYSEVLDDVSLIVTLDHPGCWIFEYGTPVFSRLGSVRMLLFKIENNKFVIKAAYDLERSKYQSDFNYLMKCKNELLKIANERELNEKKRKEAKNEKRHERTQGSER